MKHLFFLTLITASAYANAFTGCENADGSFTVSIYETKPVKVLVMDKAVSVFPFSYLCEKSTLSNGRDKLASYGCVGGGMGGDEKKIAIYLNVSQGVANYQDLDNEENDRPDLKCQNIK